jgi:hypothetical protein
MIPSKQWLGLSGHGGLVFIRLVQPRESLGLCSAHRWGEL